MFCFINQPFYISPKQKRKCLWSTMSKYWRQALLVTIIIMWNVNRKFIIYNGLLSCFMDWWRSKAVDIVGQLIVAVNVDFGQLDGFSIDVTLFRSPTLRAVPRDVNGHLMFHWFPNSILGPFMFGASIWTKSLKTEGSCIVLTFMKWKLLYFSVIWPAF